MNFGTFHFLNRTKTGIGSHAMDHLVYDLNSVNARKPLIITCKASDGKDMTLPLVKAFQGSGMKLGIYDGITESADMGCVREIFSLYRDRGFDAVIALGQGLVTDIAKVVNLAVSGSPNDLKNFVGYDNIPGHLNPFVYVATGVGDGRETAGVATFDGLKYRSHFLMPDIAIVDPRIIPPLTSPVFLKNILSVLVLLVEAYAVSASNPLIRSHAFTGIRLVMENMDDLLNGGKSMLSTGSVQCFCHAAILCGYVRSNMKFYISQELGRMVSQYCTAAPEESMFLVLPHVLAFLSRKGEENTDKLLLALKGREIYCATPLKQRLSYCIHCLQNMANIFFLNSLGSIPRCLKEAGLTVQAIDKIESEWESGSMCNLRHWECRVILDAAFENFSALGKILG